MLRTRTFPFGTVTRDRSIFAVPRAVEFMIVTAAPTLALTPEPPLVLITREPDAVAMSTAVVASTVTSPVVPIVTVLSVIEASTVGSYATTATMPATVEPAPPPPRYFAEAEPPVETNVPPPDTVISADESVDFTPRLPSTKASSLPWIVAFVVAAAVTTVTEAPTPTLRPPSDPAITCFDASPENIDLRFHTAEPAIVTTRSSVRASIDAPRRLVPATLSMEASVVVVRRCAAPDPAKFTVIEPRSPTLPPAPLNANASMTRAWRADTSRVKPSIVARRNAASTRDVAEITATAPDRPTEALSRPPTCRVISAPALAKSHEEFVAVVRSVAGAVACIVPV